MPATARSTRRRHSCGVIRSFRSRWMSDVPMKTWMRLRCAGASAFAAASTSVSFATTSMVLVSFSPALAVSFTASGASLTHTTSIVTVAVSPSKAEAFATALERYGYIDLTDELQRAIQLNATAPTAQGIYRITFSGIYAADNH